jgi:hypothetical protein
MRWLVLVRKCQLHPNKQKEREKEKVFFREITSMYTNRRLLNYE